MPTLSFHRNALRARVVGTLLLLGAIVMGAVFGELTFRSESLVCEPPVGGATACSLVSSWPGVPSHASPLSPVVGARARATEGRRGGTAVALLLEHADRTVSEHLGVGSLGERAETVALQLNDHLASGEQRATFELRQANEWFGAGLVLVFCLLPLLLLPGLYARVHVVGRPSPAIRVGRGILPARRVTFDESSTARLVIENRVVGGTLVYVLRAVGAQGSLDLVSSTDLDACRDLEARVRAALEAR